MKTPIDLTTVDLEYMADIVLAIQREAVARRIPGPEVWRACEDLMYALCNAIDDRDTNDGSLAADLAYDLREDDKLQ